MIYDVNYFIKKFEAIPEDLWITGLYYSLDRSGFCALGHCGVTKIERTEEADALESLFISNLRDIQKVHIKLRLVTSINDGLIDKYNQPTPKKRILAALYDIKKIQEKTGPGSPVSEKFSNETNLTKVGIVKETVDEVKKSIK